VSPSISSDPSYARPELPTDTRRCAAGCREIVEGDDRLCLDCATSCECLGCSVWSEASSVLGGTALVWARKAVA
jgi:hypothetical protein